MRVIRSLQHQDLPPEAHTACALGNFDGVHLGHQAILKRTRALADERGLLAGVFCFVNHPRQFLGDQQGNFLLTTPESRLARFREAGIDIVWMLPFDDSIRDVRAERFVTEILAGQFNAKAVLVGDSYRFGYKREGCPELLTRLGTELDMAVLIQQPVTADGAPVSSTRIRHLITEGKVAEAARLLGRPYTLEGRVVHGHGRGRELGIPTANLQPDEGLLLPKTGVYAAQVLIDEQTTTFPAVVNIGVCPTFQQADSLHPNPVSIEVHVLDETVEVYGHRLQVQLGKRLRDEKAFGSAEALVAQIEQDIAEARQLLAQPVVVGG